MLTGKVLGATKPVMQPETMQSSHASKESPLDSNNDHLSRSCQSKSNSVQEGSGPAPTAGKEKK